MSQSKTILMTGATGNLGGAAARHLLKVGFRVLALTRDVNSPAARSLESLGATLVSGDLNDSDSYRNYLKDLSGVFSVQTYVNGVQRERNQSIALAMTAKEANVSHFVYSSVCWADQNTRIPHWESKWEVEQAIHSLGIPYTIIRPTSLYENFLIPQVRSRLIKGKLVLPLDKALVQHMIAAEDVGKIATQIFSDPQRYAGRTITLTGEKLDGNELSAVFTEALGKPVTYRRLPGFITRLAMGRLLHNMFSWVNRNSSAQSGATPLTTEFGPMTSLRQWAREKFAAV